MWGLIFFAFSNQCHYHMLNLKRVKKLECHFWQGGVWAPNETLSFSNSHVVFDHKPIRNSNGQLYCKLHCCAELWLTCNFTFETDVPSLLFTKLHPDWSNGRRTGQLRSYQRLNSTVLHPPALHPTPCLDTWATHTHTITRIGNGILGNGKVCKKTN